MHKFGDEEIRRAAGRIWSEGRANPIHWEVRTRPWAQFATDDRSTWRTGSGEWTAELRRSQDR